MPFASCLINLHPYFHSRIMASPFKFFRKHQTQLLVVIGILTMIAFIILPSILQQLDVVGRTRPSSAIVETQKYGSLSTDEVQRLKYNQSILANFFRGIGIAYEAKLNEMIQKRDPSKINEMYQTSSQRAIAYQLVGQVGDNSNQTIVMMWLLENKAMEMGLSVNDSYINSFISERTKGLDEKTITRLIYGDENDKSASSEKALVKALKRFLLREKIIEILGSNWNAITTSENLSSICRLNQKANVELFPVNVKDFVSKVEEPSSSEISAFFDKYKDKVAEIGSSEPGLHQPQRIVLEYCYGSYEQFMDEKAITDEAVQKSYDDNKENYVIEKKDDKQENKLGEMPNIGLNAPDGKQYRLLDDDLKKEIRQSLAINAAKEKLNNAIGVVQKAMNDYNNEKDQYELMINDQDNKKADLKEPAKPNLETLAKENNLQYAKTDLFSRDSEYKLAADYNQDAKKESESKDEPVAKRTMDLKKLVLKDVDDLSSAESQFFGNPSLYQGNVFVQYEDFVDKQNNPNEEFVMWKVQDVAKHVPTLEEEGIKTQIIDQIKTIKARKLAEEEAEKLAKRANDERLPLEMCLGEDAFVPTQFPWMTFGPVLSQTMMPNIYLSPIEGVQDGGFDFMSALFQMKENEIKTIANDSQTIYYVVRMIGLTPKTEMLYGILTSDSANRFNQARNADLRLFYNDLREKLEKDAGLKWVVQPDEDAERD